MNDWWEKRKEKTRKNRKNREDYTKSDLLLDILFWIPEIIVFPLRLIFWSIRGLFRWLTDLI